MNTIDIADSTTAYSFDDIALVPRHSHVTTRAQGFIGTFTDYTSPIVNAPMINVASTRMLNYFRDSGMMRITHRFFPRSTTGREIAVEQMNLTCSDLDAFYSVGSVTNRKNGQTTMDVICELVEMGATNFLIDIAHGDSIHSKRTIEFIRSRCPTSKIIVGNVADAGGYISLAREGVFAVRVGIASGAACSTYVNTGFGLPTLYSVCHAAKYKAMLGLSSHIIADGGIRNSGDIVKSIWAGASFVMMGKILASTSRSDGTGYSIESGKLVIQEDESKIQYKEYFGMASKRMLSAYKNVDPSTFSAEGEAGLVHYLGRTEDVITGIHRNLQSALSYGGSLTWEDFRINVNSKVISPSSYQEKKVNLDKVIS